MGYNKSKRPLLAPGITLASSDAAPASLAGALVAEQEFVGFVETVTSTGTTLAPYGLSIIEATTDADRTFQLGAPTRAGVLKSVLVNTNGSTDVVAFRPASTAHVFYGSTHNILTATTGANVKAAATFLSASTTSWALISKTTGLAIS